MPSPLVMRRRAPGGATYLISPVGSLLSASASSSATLTLAASPAAGDALMVCTGDWNNGGNVAVSSVTDTNGAAWSRVAGPFFDGASTAVHEEIWRGDVVVGGSTTITAQLASSAASFFILAQEFAKAGGAWSTDGSYASSTPSSSVVQFPSLTPSGADEMYLGFVVIGGGSTLTAGSTPTFTYEISTDGSAIAFSTSLTAGVAVAPTMLNSTPTWDAIGVLTKAAS